MLASAVASIRQWIVADWHSNPVRFIVEISAWALSIGCSLGMALTVPNPPLVTLYILWIIGCAMYGWAAYTRRSFGMIANYLLLVIIDLVALTRLLIL